MNERYVIAYSFIISALCMFETQARCKTNPKVVPDVIYKNRVPEDIKEFPKPEEFYNNSLITNMFRENGINRRCFTWQRNPPNCAATLDCIMYACFRNVYKEAEEHQTDAKNQFVLELYGYVEGNIGWVSITFGQDDKFPPKDTLEIGCLRYDHQQVDLFATTENGKDFVEHPKFVKMVYNIADTENSHSKNHIYCRFILDQKIPLATNTTLDLSGDQVFYPVLAIGSRSYSFEKEDGTVLHYPSNRRGCYMFEADYPFHIYRPYEVSTNWHKFMICAHSCLAVLVFILLIPLATYPVQYHRFALNEVNQFWNVKKWVYIHLKYAIPVYPVLLISILCARYARAGTYAYISPTNSSLFSHVHGNTGIVCFQIYSAQFFFGMFSYSSLLCEGNRCLKIFHKVMNYVGYIMAIHILCSVRLSREEGGSNNLYFMTMVLFLIFQFLLHFSMKFFDSFALQQYSLTESEQYFEEVDLVGQLRKWAKPEHSDHHMIDSFWEKPPIVQEPEFEKVYIFFEYLNIFFCTCFAITLMVYVGDPKRYLPASTRGIPPISWLGEFLYDWGRLSPWMFG